jgi:23S rRNA pseudouridine1911/1915/1917 synthase
MTTAGSGAGAAAPPPSPLTVGPALDGMRVDAFLAHELPALSRARIRRKTQTGEVLVNGHRCSTATRLRAGDRLLIRWRAAPPVGPLPDLAVLWEDDAILAADKPAGVASHPMGRRQHGTVVQWARARHADAIRGDLERGGAGCYPTLVNRLDVYTSGIVLLAKTDAAHGAMQRLMTARAVEKEYVAVVEGIVERDEGSVDLPIGLDPASAVRLKRAVRPDGRPSITRFTVLRRLAGHTVLLAAPITGRQHQIRVHLAAAGHPVVGDLLYKDESLFLRSLAAGAAFDPSLPARHLLHACRLSFTHPFTGARVLVASPLPDDFRRAARTLGWDGSVKVPGGADGPPLA